MFHFESYYDNTALISASGKILTYRELGAVANQIMAQVEPRRLVFCLCSNTAGSIAGYVSFVNNRNASLMLDADMDKGAFDEIEALYCPDYIWAPSSSALVRDYELLYEADGYSLWRTDAQPKQIYDNLTLLLPTSGSTGSPKYVRLSRENLLSNAMAIIDYLHIASEERPVLGLPMYYSFGLSIINSHLLTGAAILLPEVSFAQSGFWQFANEHKFTSFSGVPYTFEMIRKLGIWNQCLPSLRTLTIAGGLLNKDILNFFDELYSPRGVNIYVMYGQTEATARISFLEPKYLKLKPNSIGKAIPGGSMSLIDDKDNLINEADTIGELVYRGSNVCLGYAESADDLSKGDENGGVIHTEDLAYRDTDGFYYFVGHKRRIAKLFGQRISLDHIELLLRPFLSDCACVSEDHRLIIYTSDPGSDERMIIDVLASRTKIVRSAFSVRYIEIIPRSNAGKVLYGSLK